MYRSKIVPVFERLTRVRSQLAVARTRPPDDAMNALELNRHELARIRRRHWRLRHPLLRLVPVTLSEAGIVAGYGTIALLLALIASLVVTAPFLALVRMRDQCTLGATATGPSNGDIDPIRAARDALGMSGF